MPIREHRAIVGHAVRAAYLMSGVVDVAGETGDKGLLDMVNRVWRNTTERNLYVTGGIGPSAANEGFTVDYDLPNLTAYQESCASVAMAMWNHRLNLLYGDAKYADLVELALYNGILAGVSLDGKRFFYVNPLESLGDHHRSEWFGCACCPPNITRTLAALGNYAYATSGNDLWVNLYIEGGVKAKVGGKDVELGVRSNYPWYGNVAIEVKGEPGAEFPLRLRVPGWCEKATAWLAGAEVPVALERGYLRLPRSRESREISWSSSSRCRRGRSRPTPTSWTTAESWRWRAGPSSIAFEQFGQPGPLSSAAVPRTDAIRAEHRPSLLGPDIRLHCPGLLAPASQDSRGLYRTASAPRPLDLVATPYYSWDNREPGAMRVWMPTRPEAAAPPGAPSAKPNYRSRSTTTTRTPRRCATAPSRATPGDNGESRLPLLAPQGSVEWIQYRWDQPIECAGVEVYWFDDTGRGECQHSGLVEDPYLDPSVDGEAWKPVAASGAYEIAKDRWCEARFEKITTKGLRLEVQLQPGWAAGALEWRVIPPRSAEPGRSLKSVLRGHAREIVGKIEAAGPRRSKELRRGHANEELDDEIRAWAE